MVRLEVTREARGVTRLGNAALRRLGGGCALAFLVLTALVWGGWPPLVSFDQRWSTRAYAFTVSHDWCLTLSRAATALGDAVTVTTLTVVVCLALLVGRRRVMAVWLAVTVAGSALLNTLVKVSLERTRPPSAEQLTSAHGFSFPSGHTQAATVFYAALVVVVGWRVFHPTQRWARLTAAAAVVVAVAVGASRVLLGAHWPSDVLGGWLLGCAWIAVATLVLRRRTTSEADS